MNRLKQLLSVALASIMVMSMCVTAFAAGNDVTTSGGTGETTVVLTADAATFSVTVPTSIDFHINADGSVTAPTNVEIVNWSSGTVQVTKIEVKEGAWGLTSYAEDLAGRSVYSNVFALQLKAGNDTVATARNGNQVLTHNANEWVMAARGHEGATLPLACAAHASAVANGISNSTNAASVIFTIGWTSAAPAEGWGGVVDSEIDGDAWEDEQSIGGDNGGDYETQVQPKPPIAAD